MRKFLLTTIASIFLASAALAGGNTGCGIGTMIFGENPGLVLQVLAVTTNGTCANQTFGITTGTLGCDRPSAIVQNDKLNDFVLANMDSLSKEISAGKGETVASLAELLKVETADRDAFYGKLQANFSKIFPTSDVTYSHVVDAIVEVANS